ncbi:tetratricopeptide repeat protein [Niallia endozanthoxylica]|uniref:Tetratricopeptide repeat protein n=1 Tax=Niallia endozanthoxylica TaxID=2036016 RepID=A0A5J5HNE2_9BACI|nr:tetratricopeptide repeat protein [Niallia endozanthoxylica]KAA9022859.1 tetratricopeptide repeat protein [Niallia endozanthoxylica]
MRLQDKTIEELLDLEEELLESKEEEKAGSLYELTRLYEELYRRISSNRNSEYGASLDQIKKTLISYLVRYGSFLKTQYKKDDSMAVKMLIKAVRYQKEIPIAYYRLGFLSYKQKDYLLALTYFQKAVDNQTTCTQKDYLLNQQQLYNAYLYITNSALYMANQANTLIKEIESEELIAQAPSYEQSNLFQLINQNEEFLASSAFTVITPEGKRHCSHKDCKNIIKEGQLPNTLILYFSDHGQTLFFNGKKEELSINHAEMLRYFFLYTSEQTPATKYDFGRSIFDTKREDGEIENNTYIQTVGRIRGKFNSVQVPQPVIMNKRHRGQTGYYYNQTIPFAIIHRIDSIFLLDR